MPKGRRSLPKFAAAAVAALALVVGGVVAPAAADPGDPGDTPVGQNIIVAGPLDAHGEPIIRVQFDSVTAPGVTTFASSASPAPVGFTLAQDVPDIWVVETTAQYSGDARVCFTHRDPFAEDIYVSQDPIYEYVGGAWQTTGDGPGVYGYCTTLALGTPVAMSSPIPGATPVGTSVGARPSGSSFNSVVRELYVGFETVSAEGITSASTVQSPPPRSGYVGSAYNIATTATFLGWVSICVDTYMPPWYMTADPLRELQTTLNRIFQYQGGSWQDITTSQGCGTSTQLGLIEVGTLAPGVTPIGTGVVISPIDSAPSPPFEAITFNTVTQAGTTTIVGSASGPTPTTFLPVTNPPFYTITSTASFGGPIRICMRYERDPNLPQAQFDTQIYHFANGVWSALGGASGSIEDSIICGTSTELGTFAIGELLPGGTEVGTNVTAYIDFPDGGSVNVTFDSVTSSGLTTATKVPTGPTPTGFSILLASGSYYEIATTAAYSGNVQVCITFWPDAAGMTQEEFNAQHLYHYDGTAWANVTTIRGGGPVCGNVTSLSPFAVGNPNPGSLNGTISGTVTGSEAGGPPIVESYVWLYSKTSGNLVASTVTDSLGQYEIPGVVPDTYRLQFKAPADQSHIGEWWNDKHGVLPATSLVVGENQHVTGIDAVLEQSGSVSGAVTANGVPVQNLDVDLWTGDGAPISSTQTDAFGHFSFSDVPSGNYTVEYARDNQSGYVTEWWQNSSVQANAQLIHVNTGQDVAGFSADIAPAASISGHVVGSPAVTLHNVQVDAYDALGVFRGIFYADQSGNYVVNGLSAGTYTLRFHQSNGGWAPEWWGDALTQAASTPIAVAAGEHVTGKDVVLVQGATISGTVQSSGDGPNPPGGVTIEVVDAGGHVAAVTYANLDSPVDYSLGGLLPGAYTLHFTTYDSPYASEWWDDQPISAGAQTITVGPGEVVTGKDAVLALGASVIGSVIDYDTGEPIENAIVTATSEDGATVRSAYTGSDGNFILGGLLPGDYTVSYHANFGNYVTSWYWFQSTQASAYLITVDVGEPGALPPGVLRHGGTISGAVLATGPHNLRVDHGFVDVYTVDGDFVRSEPIDPYGNYVIMGLIGQYKLQFRSDGLVSEWWNDSATIDDAATVDVSPVEDVVLGDAVLQSPLALTAAPTPTITGTIAVGQTLTANSGIWLPAPVSLAYQWSRDGVAVDGATASTYVLTQADAGGTLSVTVTGSKSGYAPQSKTSVQTAVITGGVLSPTPLPTISGTPAVGQTLTAAAGVWGPGAVTLNYQWKRNGVNVGGNSPTRTLVNADAGTVITVSVTGSRAGFTSVTQASAPTTIEGRLTTTPTPTITGTLAVGQTLTANSALWAPAPVDLAYQWNRGGVPIAGATGSTYALVAADGGTSVTVTVTGSKSGFTSISKTSAAKSIQSQLTSTPVPIIVGTPAVGQTLTADAGVWGPGGVTLKYQWKRDGVNVGGNSQTRVLATADAGTVMTVSVTGSLAGYTSVTQTSAPLTIESRLTTTPTPTITGTLAVGQTLTANSAAWAPAPVDLAYQWNRAGIPIAGATGSTYALVAADGGTSITVTVTGSKPGFTSISKTSAAKLIQSQLTATPVPTISGTPAVGQTATAAAGVWGPGGVTLKYQWKRGSTNIGTNSPTYVLVTADAGSQITVSVTGSLAGYTSVTQVSAPTTIEGRLTTTPTPTITGTLAVGQTLTANSAAWAPAPVDLAYQWNRGGIPIPGATGSTYLLVAADAGASITVTVTGSKPTYTSVAKTSSAKSIQLLLTATPVPTISGTTAVGQNLTATAGIWQPAPVTLKYQWKRNGVNIGTNSANYKLVTADRGTLITVTVTGSEVGYTSVSQTSVAVPIP